MPLLTNKDVSLIMRGRLYSSCVWSSKLHGSETWPVKKENVVSVQRAEMRMVRWMCGVKLKDRLPSKELRERLGWRHGVVVSRVRQWTKLTHVRPGYNWDGWPSSGGYTISGCNQPTRSTQPCIPPGSLNRVPASAGLKAGMSPLPGGR